MATQQTTSTEPADDVPATTLHADALRALNEAFSMSASIRALVDAVIDGGVDARTYALVEAIRACALRTDAAVEPLLDEACSQPWQPQERKPEGGAGPAH